MQSEKKRIKIKEARAGATTENSTLNRLNKLNEDSTWHAMEHEKLTHEAHAIAVDCGLAAPRDDYDDVIFQPSAFHKYAYKVRVPLCRK